MDKKQDKILNDILEKNELPHKNIKFKQYRNLREFKYFQIERINPNHIIKLYGTLKNKHKKRETSRNLITVGEIIIGATTLSLNIQILFIYTDIILLTLSMYIINCFLFYWFGRFKPWLKIFDKWFNYGKTLIKKDNINPFPN
jgi:hypothetical protein